MKREWCGLRIDFIGGNEHYLTLSGEEPLRTENLARLDVGMLTNNDIPGLAALRLEQQNLQVRLLYRITGRRPLDVWLRTHSPAFAERCRLLYRIVFVMTESLGYLLNENRFLVDESLIFVGSGPDDVELVYAPIIGQDGQSLANGLFAEMAARLLSNSSVQEERELREALTAQIGSLPEARKRLQQILSMQSTSTSLAVSVHNDAINSGSIQLLNTASAAEPGKSSSNPVGKQRFFFGLTILLACTAWGIWSQERNDGTLSISLGFTVLAADVVYWYRHKGWLSDLVPIGRKSERARSANGGTLPLRAADGNTERASGSVQFPEVAGVAETPERYYSELARHTTLLARPDATEWLSEADADLFASLEWEERGRIERMEIARERFIIGRAEAADLHNGTTGVSRSHAEISQGEELIDLGSKNGTYLNGERLVPFKTYPLQNGDRIRIVQTEYVYKKFPPI